MKAYQRKFQGKGLKTYSVTVQTHGMDDEFFEIQAASVEDAMLVGYALTYHHGDPPSLDPEFPREVLACRKEARKYVTATLKETT